MTGRPCKNAGDDVAHAKRPTPFPGPRCMTCQRARKKQLSQAARERNTQARFNLSPAERAAVLDAQGGVCPICQRANEATSARKGRRRLAVDHDHACCPGPTSCGKCIRGLLCSPCNGLLAHLRDDPEALLRAVQYLRHPPAQAALLTLD